MGLSSHVAIGGHIVAIIAPCQIVLFINHNSRTMALKATDYTTVRGTETLSFQRGVQINDQTSNLTVDLKFNWKKGIYTVLPKWNFVQITGDDKIDGGTLKIITELMKVARDKGDQLRREWLEQQPEDDPDQLGMEFED